MALRILTALVLIPPVIYIIGWAPEWLFVLVLIATVERSLYEYFVISRHAGFKPLPAVGYVAGALLCLAQAAELRHRNPSATPGALGFAFVFLALAVTLSVELI